MTFEVPADYKPLDGLDQLLVNSSPPAGSALSDMVVYRQWTRYSWKKKSVQEAWDHLNMSPRNARRAIDSRIVPLEIYPQVLARAQEDD